MHLTLLKIFFKIKCLYRKTKSHAKDDFGKDTLNNGVTCHPEKLDLFQEGKKTHPELTQTHKLM